MYYHMCLICYNCAKTRKRRIVTFAGNHPRLRFNNNFFKFKFNNNGVCAQPVKKLHRLLKSFCSTISIYKKCINLRRNIRQANGVYHIDSQFK